MEYIVTYYGFVRDLQTRFWIGFTDKLYTPLGTTSNYSAIADLHTLQVTVNTH
jgi:hypothetical protein